MAESVQLVLPDHDEERLESSRSCARKRPSGSTSGNTSREGEYLSGDVLKDPGSAVVWWLTRNDGNVEKTVHDIALLARLSAAANNTDVPETFQEVSGRACLRTLAKSALSGVRMARTCPQPAESGYFAADHFDAFLRAMGLGEDDPERALFARRVADLTAKHGRPEITEEGGDRFDGQPDRAGLSPEAHGGD